MFARIDGTSSKSARGLGIGLALARRLAELHGGSLRATSAGGGQGTTFTLRLPKEDAMASGEMARPVHPAVVDPATSDALNILLVEDEPDVADTLADWLQELGHTVWVARSGLTGVELAERHRPDVVLCDLGLPDIDGLEVCRRVRLLAINPRPMMVAVSGWGREDDRRLTKEAGFDEHLVKPAPVDKLRSLLSSVRTWNAMSGAAASQTT
jgi:CheY-like chemotaxis protein